MAEPVDDLDLLIEEYLDGRMGSSERARFEARLKKDPALRSKVNSATRSVELVQQALGWVTPGDEFDTNVSSKIIVLTQSGQHIRPVTPSHNGALIGNDPDARLLADPEAVREKRRLLRLALIAGLLFLFAASGIGYILLRTKEKPPAPPAEHKRQPHP